MIRIFLYCLLALGAGVALSILFQEDPGYVLLSFKGTSIEMTLVTLALCALGAFVLFSAVLWLARIFNPLKLFSKDTWRAFGRSGARAATEEGLQKLLLGYWSKAYRLLVENAEKAPSPLFNYVAAAIAAFQMGDRLAWGYCLEQAENKAASASGIRSLKAYMEARAGNTEQSLAILLSLKKKHADSPFVLRQIRDIYFSLSDYTNLEALAPVLEKNKIGSDKELLDMQRELLLYRFNAAASSENLQALQALWEDAKKSLRRDEQVTAHYLRHLLHFHKDSEAMSILGKYLRLQWSDSLVEILGYVDSNDVGQQILLLEKWVKDRPKNAMLMLTLGRLSLRKKLWGKAREYFEFALQFSDQVMLTAEINAELGRLLEHLGEHEKSMACYGRAMQLMDRKLPSLPMPETTTPLK